MDVRRVEVDRATLRALILALGMVLGGWAAGCGFARDRSADGFVTAKGIAEREVNADLANLLR